MWVYWLKAKSNTFYVFLIFKEIVEKQTSLFFYCAFALNEVVDSHLLYLTNFVNNTIFHDNSHKSTPPSSIKL